MKFDNTNRMSLTCKLHIRLDILYLKRLQSQICKKNRKSSAESAWQNIFSKSPPDEQKVKYILFCKNRNYLEYFVGGAKIFLLFIESTLNVVLVSTDLKIIFPARTQIFTLRLFQFPPNPDQIFRIPWTPQTRLLIILPHPWGMLWEARN